MDQVTQQNAALVEQAAAAAESMKDQAGSLSQAVTVFTLDGVVARAKALPAPKPAHKAAPKALAAKAGGKPLPAGKHSTRYGATAAAKSRPMPVAQSSDEGWEEF
jgi:methyl-accepting chemotaxis protein